HHHRPGGTPAPRGPGRRRDLREQRGPHPRCRLLVRADPGRPRRPRAAADPPAGRHRRGRRPVVAGARPRRPAWGVGGRRRVLGPAAGHPGPDGRRTRTPRPLDGVTMSAYDPRRSRPTPKAAPDEESAPIDALLGPDPDP